MKTASKVGFCSFFLLTYFAQVLELGNIVNTRSHLERGRTGLPEGRATDTMAKSDPKYIPSSRKGVEKRGMEVLEDMLKHTVYFLAACFFLTTIGRSLSMKMLDKTFGSLFSLEIVFLTTVISMLSLTTCVEYILHPFVKNSSFEVFLLYCFFIVVLLVPVCILLSTKLLRMFDINFIMACYFSYFILELSDILSISHVDEYKMEKVSPEIFSREVRDLIAHQRLSNAIYKEKKPSKSVNAALIGLGSGERIEIYGKVGVMDYSQLESILIHEVGHSYHKSLAKKLSTFFVLLLLEMVFLVFLYRRVAREFACENVSKEGSFLVLACLYFASVRPWLFIIYNMTSQTAEVSADLLTKTYHYNKELANTLYKISIESFDFLTPSWLYNVLTSLHPSIMSRIEYLSN